MGLLIWGSTNMLMGWATGRFGLFGTHADALASPDLNSMGIGLAVAALCLYTLVKAEAGDPERYAELDERDLFPTGTAPKVQTAAQAAASAARRVAGVAMAMTAGLLFGNTFTPPTYLMHNELGSPHPLDYVFAHFCGIYALSTAAFVAYCGYKGARGAAPFVDGRLVLPGLLSGLMWAAAQTCWFVANDALSMSVAFPLITSGPGVVSAAWGVLVFKEIKRLPQLLRPRARRLADDRRLRHDRHVARRLELLRRAIYYSIQDNRLKVLRTRPVFRGPETSQQSSNSSSDLIDMEPE